MGFHWSVERVDYLRTGHGKISASLMADHLGCTRNAVIGKRHRLGLDPLRTNNVAYRAEKMQTKRRAPKVKLREYLLPPVPVEPLNIPFMDLERFHCREIVGRGADGLSLSCGHKRMEDSSYCRWHHGLNWTPHVRKVA